MKRKRNSYTYVRLTGDEKIALYAMAGKQGISAYIRGIIAQYVATEDGNKLEQTNKMKG